MQQRLVVWGDIGTDHKALIAIEFDAAEHKVSFRAFPEELVGNEIQIDLFKWQNGGEYKFSEAMPVWVVNADAENILPEHIKLHKPEMLVQAQRQWNKKLELEDNFKVFGEKLHLLELALETTNEFNQELWNKTRDLWAEITTKKKDGNLAWTHADELKIRVNSLFDGLKAFRRLNKEHNFDESNALMKVFEKQITECSEQLIYPDEWNNIFKKLVEIQNQLKDAPMAFKHIRIIRDKINDVFNNLREYRKSDQVRYIEDRIYGLERVLRGLNDAIVRDEESYKNQFEKMKHYTRGKLSDAEIDNQLKYLKDQSKEKRKKIKSIERTLRSLDKQLEALLNPPKPEPKEEKERPGKRERKRLKKGDRGASVEHGAEALESGHVEPLHEAHADLAEDAPRSEEEIASPAEPVTTLTNAVAENETDVEMPELIAEAAAPQEIGKEAEAVAMEIKAESAAPAAPAFEEDDSASPIEASADSIEAAVEDVYADGEEHGFEHEDDSAATDNDITAARSSPEESPGMEETAEEPAADVKKTARKPKAKPKPKASSKSEVQDS